MLEAVVNKIIRIKEFILLSIYFRYFSAWVIVFSLCFVMMFDSNSSNLGALAKKDSEIKKINLFDLIKAEEGKTLDPKTVHDRYRITESYKENLLTLNIFLNQDIVKTIEYFDSQFLEITNFPKLNNKNGEIFFIENNEIKKIDLTDSFNEDVLFKGDGTSIISGFIVDNSVHNKEQSEDLTQNYSYSYTKFWEQEDVPIKFSKNLNEDICGSEVDGEKKIKVENYFIDYFNELHLIPIDLINFEDINQLEFRLIGYNYPSYFFSATDYRSFHCDNLNNSSFLDSDIYSFNPETKELKSVVTDSNIIVSTQYSLIYSKDYRAEEQEEILNTDIRKLNFGTLEDNILFTFKRFSSDELTPSIINHNRFIESVIVKYKENLEDDNYKTHIINYEEY